MPLSWAPLLDDAGAAPARAVIAEIAVGLVGEHPPAVRAARLTDGGVCTLLTAAADAGIDVPDLAGDHLEAFVRAIDRDSRGAALWGGASELTFRLAQLADGDELAAALCERTDDRIARLLDVPVWTGDHDLIAGLVGIAVAALERGDRPSAARVARGVLDHLEATAREDGDGLYWHTAPELLPVWQRERCPDGYVNLGVAHGMPGVIGVLVRYLDAGIETARARRLLAGAVAWMRARKPREGTARFPHWVTSTGDVWALRVAWCYGDLGVAAVLLDAARALADAVLEDEMLAIARRLAGCPLELSGVREASVCHGAAGVAHLFHRMYRATGDDVLAMAARTWLDRLLAMRGTATGIAGFPFDAEEEGGSPLDITNGAAGVGLVLAAAVSDAEPIWDRAFLLGRPAQ